VHALFQAVYEVAGTVARQRILAVGAFLDIRDESRAFHDGQVFRYRGDVRPHRLGQFAHAARRLLQQLDDEQTRGVGQRLEEGGPAFQAAAIRVVHGRREFLVVDNTANNDLTCLAITPIILAAIG